MFSFMIWKMGLNACSTNLQVTQPRGKVTGTLNGENRYHNNLNKLENNGLLITVFKYVKSSHKKDDDRLSSSVAGDRTGSNGLKLQRRIFMLDINNFLSMRVVKHWIGLPREVENPFPWMFLRAG